MTIDAAGCQRKIVKKIVRRGAHYLISLKGNQSTMHEEIKAFMDDRTLQKDFDKAVSVTCARGKVETRTCWQSGDLDWFADKWKWYGLKSVCKVRCEVYDKKTKTTTVDERYFISSMSVDAKKALDAVRAHWGVEAMHWILDMDFDEDHSRARTGNAAENLAMLRHVVLNVLRLDRTIFGGISKKRKELTWNEDKLFRLLLAA